MFGLSSRDIQVKRQNKWFEELERDRSITRSGIFQTMRSSIKNPILSHLDSETTKIDEMSADIEDLKQRVVKLETIDLASYSDINRCLYVPYYVAESYLAIDNETVIHDESITFKVAIVGRHNGRHLIYPFGNVSVVYDVNEGDLPLSIKSLAVDEYADASTDEILSTDDQSLESFITGKLFKENDIYQIEVKDFKNFVLPILVSGYLSIN